MKATRLPEPRSTIESSSPAAQLRRSGYEYSGKSWMKIGSWSAGGMRSAQNVSTCAVYRIVLDLAGTAFSCSCFQQMICDDQLLNLACAFIDAQSANFPIELFSHRARNNSVSTENLHCFINDTLG